jgi:hypothetical protein
MAHTSNVSWESIHDTTAYVDSYEDDAAYNRRLRSSDYRCVRCIAGIVTL